MTTVRTEPEREFVQAFARGLAVIRTFGPATPELTLADVARRSNTSRATARRSLQTLEALGYASTDGSRWTLRPRILELGYSYLGTVPAWALVRHHIEALTTTVSQPATVAVLDGGDIVYTASSLVPGVMSAAMTVGTRLPAHLTPAGRLLLGEQSDYDLEVYLKELTLTPVTERTVTDKAELEKAIKAARTSGYSLVDREMWPNIRTIAVPIHDRDNHIFAALQVCCHAGEVSIAAMKKQILPAALDAATEIDRDLALRD